MFQPNLDRCGRFEDSGATTAECYHRARSNRRSGPKGETPKDVAEVVPDPVTWLPEIMAPDMVVSLSRRNSYLLDLVLWPSPGHASFYSSSTMNWTPKSVIAAGLARSL